jgi:hypothetical protein
MVSYFEHEVPRLTAEQEAEFERLFTQPDETIDYSDIPELTDEELARFRPWYEVEKTKVAVS